LGRTTNGSDLIAAAQEHRVAKGRAVALQACLHLVLSFWLIFSVLKARRPYRGSGTAGAMHLIDLPFRVVDRSNEICLSLFLRVRFSFYLICAESQDY